MTRRPESPTDFPVPVDGIGDFVFARRTMRDQFRIDAEIARLTGSLDYIPEYLMVAAGAMAVIKVLGVEFPDGWDPEKLDPLEEDSYRQLLAVHRAVREQESTFRAGAAKAGKEGGTDTGDQSGVLVPPEVQPTAE